MVRPKKALGQHFLTDMDIAQQIVESLQPNLSQHLLELGPGTGVLTQYLINKHEYNFKVVEIDRESVAYLQTNYVQLQDRIMSDDFLHLKVADIFGAPFSLIGNFPYNISNQILFKVFENKDYVPQVVGMFQREVAMRITTGPGSKVYGLLSVLLQAYYDVEYLFTVNEDVFNPPPKVKSGVIRLIRNDVEKLDCNERLFKTVVKTSFNQRRKMLRGSLRPVLGKTTIDHAIMQQRPEQLSVPEFVLLTNLVEAALQKASHEAVVQADSAE